MGLFSGIFNSNEGKRNRKKAEQYGQQAEQQRGKVDGLLNDIMNASEGAYQDANKTVEDRYGDQLQDIEDSANANVAAGNQSISRGMMASGGDITGQGAVAMDQNQERGNEAISEALNYYTSRNERANSREDRRGDQLMMNALGGREGLYSTDLGMEGKYRSLERKRKQANKQLIGDFLGGATSIVGSAI